MRPWTIGRCADAIGPPLSQNIRPFSTMDHYHGEFLMFCCEMCESLQSVARPQYPRRWICFALHVNWYGKDCRLTIGKDSCVYVLQISWGSTEDSKSSICWRHCGDFPLVRPGCCWKDAVVQEHYIGGNLDRPRDKVKSDGAFSLYVTAGLVSIHNKNVWSIGSGVHLLSLRKPNHRLAVHSERCSDPSRHRRRS